MIPIDFVRQAFDALMNNLSLSDREVVILFAMIRRGRLKGDVVIITLTEADLCDMIPRIGADALNTVKDLLERGEIASAGTDTYLWRLA